jgi:tRNA (cmo5U34)-methyltransferase
VELMKSGKAEKITYVDISEGMIQESRKKVKAKAPQTMAQVNFICGTLQDINPTEKFDLIFTPYFLDLFEEKERGSIMMRIQAHLNPEGYWYVSDFAYPDRNLLGKAYRLVHRLLYFFFRTVCGISGQQLPNLKSELKAMNMRLVEEKYFLKRMLWAGLWKA